MYIFVICLYSKRTCRLMFQLGAFSSLCIYKLCSSSFKCCWIYFDPILAPQLDIRQNKRGFFCTPQLREDTYPNKVVTELLISYPCFLSLSQDVHAFQFCHLSISVFFPFLSFSFACMHPFLFLQQLVPVLKKKWGWGRINFIFSLVNIKI